jgi:hypothetical protein
MPPLLRFMQVHWQVSRLTLNLPRAVASKRNLPSLSRTARVTCVTTTSSSSSSSAGLRLQHELQGVSSRNVTVFTAHCGQLKVQQLFAKGHMLFHPFRPATYHPAQHAPALFNRTTMQSSRPGHLAVLCTDRVCRRTPQNSTNKVCLTSESSCQTTCQPRAYSTHHPPASAPPPVAPCCLMQGHVWLHPSSCCPLASTGGQTPRAACCRIWTRTCAHSGGPQRAGSPAECMHSRVHRRDQETVQHREREAVHASQQVAEFRDSGREAARHGTWDVPGSSTWHAAIHDTLDKQHMLKY